MKNKVFDANDTTLPNGLRVITIKRNTQIASVHCGMSIGPLFEKKDEKGISHFIEHMLFKGTQKRSNEVLNNELEQLGGEYNAYTDYTCTVYSITALEEEIEKGIELLADMLINSTFPEEEIEKERGVILAEINTSKDDIEDYSFKKVNENAFKDFALKYEIIGEKKTIVKLNRKLLQDFYDKYYSANNCTITFVSSMDHEEALNCIKNYFEAWKSIKLEKNKCPKEDNIPAISTSYKKAIEQSTITYLYTFHQLQKEDEVALKILNHKFGESANSILFRELREERGLAYDVYTHMDMSSDIKTLYIYTAVSEENVEEALKVIDECIDKIKNESITFDEAVVKLMKKVLKTAVATTLEDSTDLGNYALHQSMEGEDIYEFIEDMKKMENIEIKKIHDVARKVFNKPTIHILKPRK